MEEDRFEYLFKAAQDDYDRSAWNYSASGFSRSAGEFINYGALRADASQLRTQALSVEQQARERANLIREQFVEAMGAYQMNAAQRGISVGSGSVRSNVENSAVNLSKDIAKDKRNARMKANALRAQAKISDIGAKYSMISGIADTIGSLASAYSGFAGNSGIEDMSGQGSGWNPAKSAPTRKPKR